MSRAPPPRRSSTSPTSATPPSSTPAAAWPRCRSASPSSCCPRPCRCASPSTSSASELHPGDVHRGQRPVPRRRPSARLQRVRPGVRRRRRGRAVRLHPVPPRRHRRRDGRRVQRLRQGHLERGRALPAVEDRRRGAGAPRRGADACGPTTGWPASSAICARRSARPNSAPRRLSDVIGEYGVPTVEAAVRLVRSTTPAGGSPQEIAALARRHLRGRRLLSTPTPQGNRDIHVHVAVTVDGDRLIIDFAGSDTRPEISGVVDVRQHPRQCHRPAREPGRSRHPEERGLLQLHRAAGPGGLLPQPRLRGSRFPAGPTIPASRWATPSRSP